jgi:hypothetical protein
MVSIGLEFLAETHIKHADDEEQNYRSGENDVLHKWLDRQLRAVPTASEYLRPNALTLVQSRAPASFPFARRHRALRQVTGPDIALTKKELFMPDYYRVGDEA